MAPPPILTPGRIESLLRRRAAGEPRAALARRFGITGGQVKNLCSRYNRRLRVIYAEMGVAPPKRGCARTKALPPRPGAGVRRCLHCRENFDSWGIGNRMCDRCRNRTAWRVGGGYAVNGSNSRGCGDG